MRFARLIYLERFLDEPLELFRTRALEMQMSATNTLDMQIESQTTRDLYTTRNDPQPQITPDLK